MEHMDDATAPGKRIMSPAPPATAGIWAAAPCPDDLVKSILREAKCEKWQGQSLP